MTYNCTVCVYATDIKCNFTKHMNTKKHKKNMEGQSHTKNVEKNKIVTEYDFIGIKKEPPKTPNDPKKTPNDPKMTKNNAHLTPFDPEMTPNDPDLYNLPNCDNNTFGTSYTFMENEKGNTKWVCQHCNKNYSKKCHLTRHHKTCKLKYIPNYKALYEQTLNEKHKSEENKDKVILQLTEQLDKVLDRVGDTHITQNNIILNCYGSESLDHIPDKRKLELLKIPYAMIPKMIEEVHFNKNYPQNNNICIPNKKEPYVKVFSDDKWVYKDKNFAIKDLINKNYLRLEDFYNKRGMTELDNNQKSRYTEFQHKKEDENCTIVKEVKKNVELILLNNVKN